MPELRRDPVVGYWTIISTERSRRPVQTKVKQIQEEAHCPFCEGRESETPDETFAIRKPGSTPNKEGWQVRSVWSKNPMLTNHHPIERFGEGIYDLMSGIGRHEIIVESNRHVSEINELPSGEVVKIIETYVNRMNEFEKDPRFRYALLFKNHGKMTQSSRAIIRHARSQIIGMPVIPKRVKEELVTTKNYFDRHDRCVFCDILRQEMLDGARIVCSNKSFIALCPFASRSPFEIWILPKKHSADFGKLDPSDFLDLALIFTECLNRLKNLLSDPPYNIILHTAPYRHHKKGTHWKTIEEDYHWYFLISPRLTQAAGFEWGTGIHINPTPPEDAALLLRETEL